MSKVKFKEDKYSVEQWISSLYGRGLTPRGQSVTLFNVPEGFEIPDAEGELIDIRWGKGNKPQTDWNLIAMKPNSVVHMTTVVAGKVFKRAYVCAKDKHIKNAMDTTPATCTGWRLRHYIEKDKGLATWCIDPVYWGEDATVGMVVATTHQFKIGSETTLLQFHGALYPETIGILKLSDDEEFPKTPQEFMKRWDPYK